MNRDEYCYWMRMTNAELHELLRKIIHRQTTRSAPPLRVFFTDQQLGIGLYNRYSNTSNNTAYNVFVVCCSSARAPERRLWQWEKLRCRWLSSSLGRPPAPTRTEASAPAS
ncbi:hypothetical protein HPB48_016041 [Haemaphysalis longicornis]|uniref:Uncharacterized protein n=1 Tax=Haemaphysalis longicornis TaxID=44386 RepID=A0A9J6GJ90_HAELO|nr:hypothetical protein HPB48_016041 [Haemaphysalis longicornis]